MRKRGWSDDDLVNAVKHAFSFRQVLGNLKLVQAGGNYEHVTRLIREHKLDISHFKGQGWSKGIKIPFNPVHQIGDLLVQRSNFQSHKLKIRLYREGLKKKACEECGWAKYSDDGRLPLELDHINGDRHDNRLENLKILCPNCHSLRPTHRGRNMKKRRPNKVSR